MIKSKEIPGVNERINDVLKITNSYNFEDLVRAVFCININVKNRSALSCQMTLNLSIVEYKQCGNTRIKSYNDFFDFFYKINKVLKIDRFEDYITEDFGEVKYKFKDKYYKVIIGNGYNLVYGQLFFLDSLARLTKKEYELEEVLKYNSNIIEFFEMENFSDEEREIKFIIPSERLFNKTNEFFESEFKKLNVKFIREILNEKNDRIERMYFTERGNNIYPLYNTAILVDLFNIWYSSLSDDIKQAVVDSTIFRIISDLTLLDQGNEPDVLYPVALFKNGKADLRNVYSFLMKCQKGAIICINKEKFENEDEMRKELERIKQSHKKNELNFCETIKRDGEEGNLGVTITKNCDLHFIIYDSYVNISEPYIKLGERDREYYECTALDLSYLLLFMDNQNELLEYISEKDEGEYGQILGVGGDSSKFFTWKDSGHMIVRGALQYGIIDIGHNVENDYVLDYFKNTLKDYPYLCKENYLLNSPFSWKIMRDENGAYQYVNKIQNHFGGMLFSLKNGTAVFFVHNLNLYEKNELKNDYFEVIRLVDELNYRKFKKIGNIIEKSSILNKKLVEVMFLPTEYGTSAGIRKDESKKYVYSDLYYDENVINIRYMINYEKLRNDIMNCDNSVVENTYFKELFKPVSRIFKNEYEQICKKLDEENKLKKEVDVFQIEISYMYNKSFNYYNVQDIDYLNAKKEISKICKGCDIEPGEYWGKDANIVIRNMQQQLIDFFENQIKQFDRIDLHIKLLDICANTYHNVNINRKRFKSFNNVDKDVLNEVQLKTIKNREQSKHQLRVISYLIESNLFLERNEKRKITNEELNKLLAFSNWLVILSDNADVCYFTDKETHINIDFDYVIEILSEDNNDKNVDEFNMRVYSNDDYLLKGDEVDLEFVERTKVAFQKDTSLNLINLFDVCSYFQMYATEGKLCTKLADNVYSISEENINKCIQDCISKLYNEKIDDEIIRKSIEFISLDVSKLKTIGNKEDYYLPIGKRRERNNRFDIKPLISENGMIYFSPVLVSYVHEYWKNGILDNYLPYEIGLDNTVKVMREWKRRYEKEIVFDIQKIFQNNGFSYVEVNVELYKIDKKAGHPIDLGDYDVLAIDDSKLKIWLIESKVLKKVGSFFEMYHQQRGFFLDHKDDEDFQRRIDYMKNNYKKILKALKFDSSNSYDIIPYMVVNKVMSSRYKKIDFPIISIGELEDIIKNEK